MKAFELTKGQRIEVDMGYAGQTFCDEWVTVLSVSPEISLFNTKQVSVDVMRFNGERMTCSFYFEDQVRTK